jgi:hypothetical protein
MAGRRRVAQSVAVDWYGDEFLAIVDRYGDAALYAAGTVLRQAASSRAPRRRGQLAASGYVATASQSSYVKRRYWRKEQKPGKHTAVIAYTAPHAHLIESGRRRAGKIAPRRRNGKRALRVADGVLRRSSRYRRSAAQPFLAPAIDATRDAMASELAALLRQRLESDMPR